MKVLTDNELIITLKNKVALESKTVFEIISYLKEVQKRRLFSDYGYRSLHDFCVNELGYSDGETSRKIRTIKLVDTIPEAREMIESGGLNITNASSLFTHFSKEKITSSPEKKLELLQKIENNSTREVERILAETTGEGEICKPKESRRAIAGKRISVKFSIEKDEYKKLQNLMMELGAKSMDELVIKMREKVEEKKEVQERKVVKSKKREYISAGMRRKVLKRDINRCVICGSKNHIELDHKIPLGKGGESTTENLRAVCKWCNQLLAIKEYGLEHMDQYINLQ